jgi:hypothetical protein
MQKGEVKLMGMIIDLIEKKMGIKETLYSIVMTVVVLLSGLLITTILNWGGIPIKLSSWPPSVLDTMMTLAIFFTILANEKEKTNFDKDPYPYDQDKGEGLHDD